MNKEMVSCKLMLTTIMLLYLIILASCSNETPTATYNTTSDSNPKPMLEVADNISITEIIEPNSFIVFCDDNSVKNEMRISYFIDNDVLPFLHEYRFIPRLVSITGWPPSQILFNVISRSVTLKYDTDTSFENTLSWFMQLMKASGFERISCMNSSLIAHENATNDCVVFRKENEFVSIQLYSEIGSFRTRGSCFEDADVQWPIVLIRAAIIDDWEVGGFLYVYTDVANEARYEALNIEIQYSFFEDEVLSDLNAFHRLSFSLQQIIQVSPVYIVLPAPGGHRIEFVFDIEVDFYYELLSRFTLQMKKIGFVKANDLDLKLVAMLEGRGRFELFETKENTEVIYTNGDTFILIKEGVVSCNSRRRLVLMI